MDGKRLYQLLRWPVLALILTGSVGCGGPGRIEFVDGHCIVDGKAADRQQVETRQATVTKRILNRQPLFALITALVVALAGMGLVEKLILVLSSRPSQAAKPGERLRAVLLAKPVEATDLVAHIRRFLGDTDEGGE